MVQMTRDPSRHARRAQATGSPGRRRTRSIKYSIGYMAGHGRGGFHERPRCVGQARALEREGMTCLGGKVVASVVSMVWLVVAVIFLTAFGAGAQPAGKVWRIGFLGTTSPKAHGAFVDAFRAGLRE